MPKPIDELAMDWVLISLEPPSENNLYSTQSIYEEMCGRVGLENTEILVDKAINILKMVGAVK